MTHELVKLPYAPDALSPVISKETIEYHHGKHLATYVANLNKLIQGTEFEQMSLEDIVLKSDGGIFNNAGQTLNHNLFFTQFCPQAEAQGRPSGKLMEAIERDFGSFEKMQDAMNEASVTLFGSGWSFLSADKNGKLLITKEQNAGNPLTSGLKPLLAFDVWEHSYYLSYQNRRADHVKDLWSIIKWNEVEHRYEA